MHVNSEKIGFTINSQIKNGSKTCPSYKVINGFYRRTNKYFRPVCDLSLCVVKSKTK